VYLSSLHISPYVPSHCDHAALRAPPSFAHSRLFDNSALQSQPSSVLRISPPKLSSASPPALARENYLLHPAFLPPCEHGRDGDMHAHAFGEFRSAWLFSTVHSPKSKHVIDSRSDLLSLSNGSPAPSLSLLSPPVASEAIPASIPSHPSSVLSATCPSTQTNGTLSNGSAAGSAPKPRRMSSSTTGVLGRGKLGLMGEGNMGLGSVGKDA
jgi:hypothetical protein